MTLYEELRDLGEAVIGLRDAIAKALGIYKLLDWIEKRCKGEK